MVLPVPVAIFTAHRVYASPEPGMFTPDFQLIWCLGEEHDRLDRFLLAEERPGRSCYPAVVEPVPEQVPGHGGYAGIAVCSPLPHPVTQVVDELRAGSPRQ